MCRDDKMKGWQILPTFYSIIMAQEGSTKYNHGEYQRDIKQLTSKVKL